jgi:hypothetical protein
MRLPNPDQARSAFVSAAKLAGAGVMASWFAWQLYVLHGHIPL